jgi:hypothetical protein
VAKKYTKKQIKKLVDKKCYFCSESDYALLDVHRILEGKDGGKYHEQNTITVCVSCHRKIHAQRIKVFRKYTTTLGRTVLHFIDENGQEHYQ